MQITVGASTKAEFAFCYLYACENMWKGIKVGPNSTLGFHYNRIEDAQYAIFANTISNLYLNSNEFKRNYIGVYLKATYKQPGTALGKSTPKLLTFANNTFESSVDGTRLNYPYAGQYPLPTKYNTFVGLRVEDMNLVLPSRQQNLLNTFKGISIGMLLKNATVDIAYNCRFENITFDGNKDQNKYGDYHDDDDIYPLGVAIYSNNVKLNLIGINNKNNINKLPTIENFARAGFYSIGSSLDISNFYLLNSPGVSKLKFLRAKVIYGIYAETLKNLVVKYSTFDNELFGQNAGYTYYGVYAPSSFSATEINIQNANFSSPVLGSAIFVNGYKGTSPLLIKYCDFDRYIINQDYKKEGVFLTNCNFPNVIHNKFYWRTLGDVITIDNCKKTKGTIEENYIMGNDEKFSSTPVRGIVITGSNDMRICSNYMDSTHVGTIFTGNCTGTIFGQNNFHYHTISLSIGDSKQGATTIIDPQVRKDNYWTEGQSYNLDGLNYFSSKDNQFLIEKGVNYYPLFPKLLNPSNAKWFINDDTTYPLGCTLSEPPGITPFTDGVLDDEWYETFNDVEKWEARRHVYREIYEGEYGNSDDRLSVFYLKQFHTIVGEVERVHILMDDAYRISSSSLAAMESLKSNERAIVDMIVALMATQVNKTEWDVEALNKYELYIAELGKIQVQVQNIEQERQDRRSKIMYNAKELNDGITANTEYEKDELRLNQIEIETLIDNRDLTDAEVNDAEIIAHKCEKVFGSNVRRAYNMLPLCVRSDFKVGCDGKIDIFDEPVLGRRIANKQAEVYPNPVNDVLVCNYMSMVEQVKLVNSQGQVVKTFNLDKGTQSLEIDVKSISTGIYGLVLQHFDNTTTIKKIVVQH